MTDFSARDSAQQHAGGMESSGGFLEILAMVRRRLWSIVAITIVGTALVILATLQLTPRYTATTDILIEPSANNVVDIEAVMTGLGTDASAIASQVQVLQSRSLARRAVAKLDLMNDPEFNPALREPPGLLASIVSLKWLNKLLRVDSGSEAPVDRTEIQTEVVINNFLNSLDVERDADTYIIQVSFTTTSPQKSATIANALSDLYLLEQFEAKFEATQRATNWLNDRLGELREDVNAKAAAVEQYRAQNNLVGTGGSTVFEQQLADLNGQLAAVRADRAEADAKYQRVRQMIQTGGDIATLADVLNSPTISDLKRQESELIREEAELSTRYGDLHPDLINVRAERQDIAAQIEREVNKIVVNLETEVDVVARREAAIRQSIEELKASVSEGNRAEVELGELRRQAEAAQTLYETFLNRFGETEQQETNQEADARIISPATPPVAASFPILKLHLALGLFFSFVISIIVATILERLDNGFRSSEQIESSLGMPLLGTVPVLSRMRGKSANILEYVIQKPGSVFAESLRSLRTAAMLSNVDNPPVVVLFTSSIPGEGKTTSAVAMARAAAASGVRTLLIDADLRRPTVAKSLGMKPSAGLVELISGTVSLAEALVTDEATGLHVVGVVSSSPSPPDLLKSHHMSEFLREARKTYDLVVVDTPPVLPVSDSRVLAQHCDATVFVVRWETTPREVAIRAVHDLRNSNVHIAGAVFTQVDLKKQSRRYYGGYGYGHYRRYQSYYKN